MIAFYDLSCKNRRTNRSDFKLLRYADFYVKTIRDTSALKNLRQLSSFCLSTTVCGSIGRTLFPWDALIHNGIVAEAVHISIFGEEAS